MADKPGFLALVCSLIPRLSELAWVWIILIAKSSPYYVLYMKGRDYFHSQMSASSKNCKCSNSSLVNVFAYSIAVMESLNCSFERQTFEDSMLAL